MGKVTISARQTPCFRASIKTESGDWFDKSTDLATQEELTAEEIDAAPISYSVFRTESALNYSNSGRCEPVEGFQDVEISSAAFLTPAEVATKQVNYNFSFTPEARASFPFADVGAYFVDFVVYPKTGAAIVWRDWVIVQ